MNAAIEEWKAQMLAVAQFFSSETVFNAEAETSYGSYRELFDVEMLNTWFYSTVLQLVARHIVPGFWERFAWAAAPPESDEFREGSRALEDELLEATRELCEAHGVIVDVYRELFLNCMSAQVSCSSFRVEEKSCVRFFDVLNGHLWSLVLNHHYQFAQGDWERDRRWRAACKPGVWKSMLYTFFKRNFELRVERGEGECARGGGRSYDVVYEEIVGNLHRLNLVELCEDVVGALLFSHIESKIRVQYAGSLYEPCQLKGLLQWVSNVCVPWLESVVAPAAGQGFELDATHAKFLRSPAAFFAESPGSFRSDASRSDVDREWGVIFEDLLHRLAGCPTPRESQCQKEQLHSKLSSWRGRLEYDAMKSFSTLRIGEMFDIIVDYPDTMPAILDLKECLAKTKQYTELVNSLRSVFKIRLLHPGAYTTDIITAYLSCFMALHELDSSGTLFEHASVDLKNCLRQRRDTLRVIVSTLIDTDNGEHASILNEIAETDSHKLLDAASTDSDDDSDDGDDAFELWRPKPSIAQPGGDCSFLYSKATTDKLCTLLSIYDSKAPFISTYSDMLAERLLSCTTFDVEKEVRNVELLKLKLGDSSMQISEIMLKDIAESKRINHYFQEAVSSDHSTSDPPIFSSTIISYSFWPSQPSSAQLRLPHPFHALRERFSSEYAKLKASRKLNWYDHLGVVELELTLSSDHSSPKSSHFTVTPAQAACISAFQDNQSLSLDQLADLLNAPEDTAKKCLSYWTTCGILHECSHRVYQLTGSLERDVQNPEPEDDLGKEPKDDGDDDDSVLEPFILSMLKNLGALPFNRICKMAKSHMDCDKTSTQMKEFLQNMINSEQIEYSGGEYRLASNSRL